MVGLPVITTKRGGQASYVRDGEDGYFVECGNVNELSQKIERILGSFADAKEMGDQGKKSYREQFLAKRTGEKFMKMYKGRAC